MTVSTVTSPPSSMIDDNTVHGKLHNLLYSNIKHPSGQPLMKLWFVVTLILLIQAVTAVLHILVSASFNKAGIDSFLVAAIRLAISNPSFFVMMKVMRVDLKLSSKDHKTLMWCGLLFIPSIILSYLLGVALTSAVNVAIFAPSQPVFTAGLMLALGKEKFHLVRFLVIGCFLLIVGGENDKEINHTAVEILIGNCMLMINHIAIALFLIVQMPLLARKVHAMVVNSIAFFYATIVIFIAAAIRWATVGNSYFEPLYGSYSFLVWMTMMYFVYVATCIAWPIQSVTVKHSSPTIVSAFTPAQPLLTMLLSVMFLDMTVQWYQYFGAGILTLGLYLVLKTEDTVRMEILSHSLPEAKDVDEESKLINGPYNHSLLITTSCMMMTVVTSVSLFYSKTEYLADGKPKLNMFGITLLIIIVQVIVGGMQVILSITFAKAKIDSILLAFLRMLFAAPSLLLVTRIIYGKCDYPRIYHNRTRVLGYVVTPTVVLTFFYGLSMTNAVNAAAITPSQPVFVCLFMVMLGKERFSCAKFCSVLITITGTLILVLWDVIVGDGGDASAGSNPLLGNVFLMLNIIGTAWMGIVQKPVVDGMNPMYYNVMLFYYSIFSFVGLVLFRWYAIGSELFLALHGDYTLLVWSAILYSSIIATAVMWPVSAYALRHAGPTLQSAFSPMQPLITSCLSVVFISTAPTWGQLIGGIVIICGLWGVVAAKKSENFRTNDVSLKLSNNELVQIVVACTEPVEEISR